MADGSTSGTRTFHEQLAGPDEAQDVLRPWRQTTLVRTRTVSRKRIGTTAPDDATRSTAINNLLQAVAVQALDSLVAADPLGEASGSTVRFPAGNDVAASVRVWAAGAMGRGFRVRCAARTRLQPPLGAVGTRFCDGVFHLKATWT